MKLSISTIAWEDDENDVVRDLLPGIGVTALEIVPGKIRPGVRPADLTNDDVCKYRDYWAAAELPIIAMHGMLFGTANLAIFETPEQRAELLQYIKKIFEIGSLLGVKYYIFGSVKNRSVGKLSQDRIDEIAVPFFREAGAIAQANNSLFCIEPLPADYGCDYIVSLREASHLVKQVSHEGFGVHFDSAAISMAGEASSFDRYSGQLNHFHASEMNLQPIEANGSVKHRQIAQSLSECNYNNHISIEVRRPDDVIDIQSFIAEQARLVKELYRV